MMRRIGMFVLLCSAMASAQTTRSPGDLSGTWQLFVDDAIVAEKNNLTRTWHAFDKHPANPVMRADKPWEGSVVYVYGSVLPAEDGQGYRMWYHAWDGAVYRNLYATSPDGLVWNKPSLGLVAYDGNKDNNIFLYRTKEDHNAHVIHTPWDSDPQRRYKLINWDYGRTPPNNVVSGYYGAWSPDGIHWTDAPKNPVLPDPTGDVGNFNWDATKKQYLGYVKLFTEVRGFRRRCVGYSTTTNFESWPAGTMCLTPDEYDDRWTTDPVHHTDFYGLCVFPYETMYIGFLWVFRITAKGDDGPIFIELVSSRDGVNWTRQDAPRTPVLPLGPAGSWDAGMLFTTNHPLVEDGTIKLYYGGFDVTHAVEPAKGGVGLATLRKDGFVSLDAGDAEGSVTTTPLANTKGVLEVNFATREGGSLRVEVLDENGAVIPGYGKAGCLPLTGDHTAQTVTWRKTDASEGSATLPKSQGSIRLRFHVTKASLYSFNFK